MATRLVNLARPFSLVVLVLLGALGVVGVVVAAFALLALPARVSTSIGRNAVVWAFPGVVFQPLSTRPDAHRWHVAYVLANKDHTLILSALQGGPSVSSQNGLNGLVTLSDTGGRAYAEQPDTGIAPLADATLHFYAVTVFPPLQPGTTALWVHHNVLGGGTVRVPVNVGQIAAVPGPVHPNLTRAAGHVGVTLTTITRGALLSQVDLSAHGFVDPGGEVTKVGNNGLTQRPSQTTATVTMHTASGVDLVPRVGVGPVDKGVVVTTIGFRTPPRGTTVTLTIDNYELSDLPPNRRTTRGHWVFTFRMP